MKGLISDRVPLYSSIVLIVILCFLQQGVDGCGRRERDFDETPQIRPMTLNAPLAPGGTPKKGKTKPSLPKGKGFNKLLRNRFQTMTKNSVPIGAFEQSDGKVPPPDSQPQRRTNQNDDDDEVIIGTNNGMGPISPVVNPGRSFNQPGSSPTKLSEIVSTVSRNLKSKGRVFAPSTASSDEEEKANKHVFGNNNFRGEINPGRSFNRDSSSPAKLSEIVSRVSKNSKTKGRGFVPSTASSDEYKQADGGDIIGNNNYIGSNSPGGRSFNRDDSSPAKLSDIVSRVLKTNNKIGSISPEAASYGRSLNLVGTSRPKKLSEIVLTISKNSKPKGRAFGNLKNVDPGSTSSDEDDDNYGYYYDENYKDDDIPTYPSYTTDYSKYTRFPEAKI